MAPNECVVTSKAMFLFLLPLSIFALLRRVRGEADGEARTGHRTNSQVELCCSDAKLCVVLSFQTDTITQVIIYIYIWYKVNQIRWLGLVGDNFIVSNDFFAFQVRNFCQI